jgi:hypothetical protein
LFNLYYCGRRWLVAAGAHFVLFILAVAGGEVGEVGDRGGQKVIPGKKREKHLFLYGEN